MVVQNWHLYNNASFNSSLKRWNPEESNEEQDLEYWEINPFFLLSGLDCQNLVLGFDFLSLCLETVVVVWTLNVFVSYIHHVCKGLERNTASEGRKKSLISLSQPCERDKQNSIHLDSKGRKKKYVSNGYLKGWTNKTWDLIADRCFYHLSVRSIGSQVSYSQDDLEKSTLSLASAWVCFVCVRVYECVCLSVCVCGLWRSGHYFLLLSVLAAGHVWVAWWAWRNGTPLAWS